MFLHAPITPEKIKENTDNEIIENNISQIIKEDVFTNVLFTIYENLENKNTNTQRKIPGTINFKFLAKSFKPSLIILKILFMLILDFV